MSVRLFLRFGWDAFQAFLSQPPASLVFLQNILLLFSVSAVISFPYATFSSRIQWALSFDTIYFFFQMIFFLKYLQDTKDSKRAFPSSCFLSLGYFAAPEVLGTSLSDAAFYCFLSLLESTLSVCVPVLITLKLPFKDFPVVIIEAFRGRGCLSPNTKHSGHQLLPAWMF